MKTNCVTKYPLHLDVRIVAPGPFYVIIDFPIVHFKMLTHWIEVKANGNIKCNGRRNYECIRYSAKYAYNLRCQPSFK